MKNTTACDRVTICAAQANVLCHCLIWDSQRQRAATGLKSEQQPGWRSNLCSRSVTGFDRTWCRTALYDTRFTASCRLCRALTADAHSVVLATKHWQSATRRGCTSCPLPLDWSHRPADRQQRSACATGESWAKPSRSFGWPGPDGHQSSNCCSVRFRGGKERTCVRDAEGPGQQETDQQADREAGQDQHRRAQPAVVVQDPAIVAVAAQPRSVADVDVLRQMLCSRRHVRDRQSM